MKIPRWTLGVALVLGVVATTPHLRAQGITTAAISGTVLGANQTPIADAQVEVLSRGTGSKITVRTRGDGRYQVQGLSVGGPYAVTVRHLGSESQTKENIYITLGQNVRVDFNLTARAVEVAAVRVVAAADNDVISRAKTGIGTQISDSTIRRMASPNRDFADFASLTPQVATSGNGTGNGLSAGGMNTRFNNVQIDGANNTDLYAIASGNNSEPGSAAGAKAISIEAVKEYQVLLSPFDVRQGGFAGLVVNAVTKSGTNELHGSTYYYRRDHDIERRNFPNGNPLGDFDQRQYGFSLGGPIWKDKVFFFVAPEWKKERLPSTGTYIGAGDEPVTTSQIDALNAVLSPLGIAGGTGESVPRQQPVTNLFLRFDVNLTANHRLVARYNHVEAERTSFSRTNTRNTLNAAFPLTSNQFATTNTTKSPVIQLLSNFSSGMYNELLMSRIDILDYRETPLSSPMITVTVPNTFVSGQFARLIAGEESSSPGNRISQTTTEITDNLTIPFGSHSITVGGKAQFYHPNNLFANNLRGNWVFADMAALQAGIATSYSASVPVGNVADNGGAAIADARVYSGYIQDQWQATPNLTLTAGVRVDMPSFAQKPEFNAAIPNEFPGRSTSDIPTGQAQIAPRVSFNWDATGNQRNQVRGGVGVFTGPPAYVWLINSYANTGVYGFASLSCTGTTTTTSPPAFNPANIATPPSACGTAGSAPAIAATASVNLTDPNFKYPSSYKASLGYDHRFLNSRWSFLNGMTGTVEGLFTHALYTPFFENLALAGPQGTDRFGRVMYGNISATGATASINPKTSRTAGVYDMGNSTKDWSYNLTGSVAKRFAQSFEGSLAYTYSQARDVQSVINSTAASSFNQGRNVKGSHHEQNLGRSHWEQPHRVIAMGTWTLFNTDISAIYTGGNGSAYDYSYTGASGQLGDINADGRNGNDLVYVPKDVNDPNEILWTGYNSTNPLLVQTAKDMANAFHNFIETTPCLRNQRGRIMDRNSCRAPWINNTNVALRHSVPTVKGHNASVQLDIFNFANLLNSEWGLNRQVIDGGLPGDFLLTRSGTDLAYPGGAQHIYTFNPAKQRSDPNRVESVYRLQLSMRYSF